MTENTVIILLTETLSLVSKREMPVSLADALNFGHSSVIFLWPPSRFLSLCSSTVTQPSSLVISINRNTTHCPGGNRSSHLP